MDEEGETELAGTIYAKLQENCKTALAPVLVTAARGIYRSTRSRFGPNNRSDNFSPITNFICNEKRVWESFIYVFENATGLFVCVNYIYIIFKFIHVFKLKFYIWILFIINLNIFAKIAFFTCFHVFRWKYTIRFFCIKHWRKMRANRKISSRLTSHGKLWDD